MGSWAFLVTEREKRCRTRDNPKLGSVRSNPTRPIQTSLDHDKPPKENPETTTHFCVLLIFPFSSSSFFPLRRRETDRREQNDMYRWRKFEFFEEKSGGKAAIPSEITGKIQCCSSGRGKIAVGCDDGTVALIDRSFKLSSAFQAHSSAVLFLQQLKVSFL